jgi:hypothetical protein
LISTAAVETWSSINANFCFDLAQILALDELNPPNSPPPTRASWDIVGIMSSPEITRVNAVRWRLSIVDRRMKEAVELLREAAGTPGYSGPPFDVVERMAGLIGEIRTQVAAWSFAEQQRDAARPQFANRAPRAIRRTIAVARVRS